ncbi:hypothetical protein BDF19DRAFT_221619 [Syncephalis fuscata]|nr:hypothetical protein BDF19DRAFT_221619 [Syncephalis fuscata]
MNMNYIRRDMGGDADAHQAPMSELKLLIMTLPMESTIQQFLTYFVLILLCLSERAASYMLERYPYRYPVHRRQIFFRTGFYSMTTILRYLIMLAVMSFLPGVFISVMVSLSAGQLLIEVMRANTISRGSELAPLASPLDYRKVMPSMQQSHDEEC